MLVSEESANNKPDETEQTLLRTVLVSKPNLVQQTPAYLSSESVDAALKKNLDLEEENCLEYIAGHFFKRLLSFHKEKCSICSSHAQKYSNSSNVSSVSHMFMYFKRFQDNKSTLYVCDTDIVDYVRCVLQIANLVFDKIPATENIISLIVQSSIRTKWAPKLCNDQMLAKFTHVVARTILFYKARWLNDMLKSKGPKARGKKSIKKKKTDKLSHK